jgi:hypothetical protein
MRGAETKVRRQGSPETSVRGLGECGGHVWAPTFNRGADPTVRPHPVVRGLEECGGHVWAPALNRGADPVSATRA